MANTDIDHLPFQTITGATTFNDWRRITNGLGSDQGTGTVIGGSFYLGDFDWSGRVSRAAVLPIGATTGTESPIDGSAGLWNPSDSVTYDSAQGGVRFTLANAADQTQGSVTGKMRQWARISTRMPIDEFAKYRVKVRIKNLATSGVNRIFLGFIGLNTELQALRTDNAFTFNYGLANDEELTNNAVTEYSAIINGFNASGENASTKFDPGAKFADIIFINQYVSYNATSDTTTGEAWEDSTDDVIIQSIQVDRMPAGLILDSHDSTDGAPSANLYVGHNDVQAQYGTSTAAFINGSIDTNSHALIFNQGSSSNIDHLWHDDTATGTDPNGGVFRFSSDSSYKEGEYSDDFANYADNLSGHSHLAAGYLIADGNDPRMHNSMKQQLFIGQTKDHSVGGGTSTTMLTLAIGDNLGVDDGTSAAGHGPAIDFHVPDSTGSDTLSATPHFKVDHTHLAGRISCVKIAGNRDGAGQFVFSTAQNVGTNNDGELKEGLIIHPGTAATNSADRYSEFPTQLKVTGGEGITQIRNLTYKWPTGRNTGAVSGNVNRVLCDTDGNGTLQWLNFGAQTFNQTVFNRDETMPIGSVVPWAGQSSTIPTGWVECLGQQVKGTGGLEASGLIESGEVQALFDAIGNVYGGSGISNFKIPNLKQKVVVGRHTGVTNFGVGSASEVSSITISNQSLTVPAYDAFSSAQTRLSANQSGLPAHNHASGYNIAGAFPGRFGATTGLADQQLADVGSGIGVRTSGSNTSTAGGNAAALGHSHNITIPEKTGVMYLGSTHSTYQPYLALTYIIKVRRDRVAALSVDLNSADFTSTGGAVGELGFDTQTISLQAGHPTWEASGRTNVRGKLVVYNYQQSPSIAETNEDNLLFGRTRVGHRSLGDGSANEDSSPAMPNAFITGVRVAKNDAVIVGGNDQVWLTVGNTTAESMKLEANAALVIKNVSGNVNAQATLPKVRISDITAAGNKAIATKEYVDANAGADFNYNASTKTLTITS
jgi:microcystin-dependent protein